MDQDHETRETESFHRARELELEGHDRQVHAAARWIAATFELADRKRYGRQSSPASPSASAEGAPPSP